MKKIIIGVIAMVMVITAVCVWVVYDNTHYTAYMYRRGASFDTGMASGNNWHWTGEKIPYTIDQLKELASECQGVDIIFSMGGCVGFSISEYTELIVPELTIEDGIAESYGVWF